MIIDAFRQAVYSVLLFALLAIPGWFFRKKQWITTHQVDGISTLLVNFIWPVMVIDAMLQAELSASTGKDVLLLSVVTVAGILVLFALSLGLFRWRRIPILSNGIYVFALMFANTGLIGMPLIKTMLGEEALFPASIVELVNDILIFSVGILLMQKACGKQEKTSLRSLFSPGFIGMLLGLLLFLFQIKVPSLLSDAFRFVASATTPLTMFLVGSQLAELTAKELFCDKKQYGFAFLKLVLVPALIYLPLKIFLPQFSLIPKVLVLLFAMPSGACCALFARQYEGNYGLATRCVSVTTLLSMLSLPVWMVLCSLP